MVKSMHDLCHTCFACFPQRVDVDIEMWWICFMLSYCIQNDYPSRFIRVFHHWKSIQVYH